MRGQLDRAHGAVRQGLADARTLIASLRGQTPAAPSAGGLRAVLADFITAVNTEALDFSLEVDESAAARLAPSARHELLCISREAIHNALKHADARSVTVRIGVEAGQPGWVTATVQDDGCGFNMQENESGDDRGHFGLHGMKERAARVRGVPRMDSTPGAGTRVHLRVPFASTKTAADPVVQTTVAT